MGTGIDHTYLIGHKSLHYHIEYQGVVII